MSKLLRIEWTMCDAALQDWIDEWETDTGTCYDRNASRRDFTDMLLAEIVKAFPAPIEVKVRWVFQVYSLVSYGDRRRIEFDNLLLADDSLEADGVRQVIEEIEHICLEQDTEWLVRAKEAT